MKTTLLIILAALTISLEGQNITLQDLKDYQEYCYNDSTEIVTHECPDGMIGCGAFHSNLTTIHRPPTFEGFIEWMEKPYGIEGDTIIFLKDGYYEYHNLMYINSSKILADTLFIIPDSIDVITSPGIMDLPNYQDSEIKLW